MSAPERLPIKAKPLSIALGLQSLGVWRKQGCPNRLWQVWLTAQAKKFETRLRYTRICDRVHLPQRWSLFSCNPYVLFFGTQFASATRH
jgi:hypothetical protein